MPGPFSWLHPLVYARAKGLAELSLLSSGAEHVSIFRPGLLNRGSSDRLLERLAVENVPGLAVEVRAVAGAMVADAERVQKRGGGEKEITLVEGNGDIVALSNAA